MKIVLITGGWISVPPDRGGGAEAFIFNLAKRLSNMGHVVTVLDRKQTRYESDVEYVDGVKIVKLKSTRIYLFNFNISFALTQVIFGLKVIKWLKEDTHIIHVYTALLGLVLAVREKKIRDSLFYTSLGLRRDKVTPGVIDRIALAVENRLVRMVKKTTISNEIIAEKLIKQAGVNPEKVQVVHIGVDTEQFQPYLDTGDLKQRYGLEGKHNILFVGRICVEKGVEYLIKAVDILINQIGENKVQLLIVGPTEQFGSRKNGISPYRVKIDNLVKEKKLNSNIRFTGPIPVDELATLYSACDMVVIPSIVDLDPQVQIEAMASGKPVIGTNIGTMPKRIENSLSGFIISPAHEQQLAIKIRYLLNNPLEMRKMGAYARQLVVEKYSANKMAERMLRVFEDASRAEYQ